MDDLRLPVERGIVVKLQVTELAELVERDDVCGHGGFGIEPPVASVRRVSVRRTARTMPRQPEISF
jgi:CRISPR/Cas system-associated protein Cas7 (RAMP superfamily)